MERIAQGAPSTLTNAWYSGDDIADPGATTVRVQRWDGTDVLAAGTATVGAGATARAVNLTLLHTALLDRLKLTWTSANFGIAVTQAEVVGGYWFSIADARADDTLKDEAKYATADIKAKRTEAEQALEGELHCAYVPRFELEVVRLRSWRSSIPLKWPMLRAVRSISQDGTAWSAPTLAGIVLGGQTLQSAGWGPGHYIIGYEHGYDGPDGEGSRVALKLAKHYLVGGPGDDRALGLDVDSGAYTFAVPGRGGSRFGLPEVDAFIRANQFPLVR